MSTTENDTDHVAEEDHPRIDHPTERINLSNVNTQGFLELRVWAQTFDDVQRHRLAIANRLRSGQIPADVVAEILSNATRTEKMVGLAMRRSFRRVAPRLYDWSKATPGIGEHLLARLLGTIGHPCIATPHHWEGEGAERVLVEDEPFVRNVAKLWAYCGHGDPTRRRKVGMSAADATGLGNPRAKVIAHLLAETAMKVTGSAGSGDVSKIATDDHTTFDASSDQFPDGSTNEPIPGSPPNHQDPSLHDAIADGILHEPAQHGESFPGDFNDTSEPMSNPKHQDPSLHVTEIATASPNLSQHGEPSSDDSVQPPTPTNDTDHQLVNVKGVRLRSPYRDVYEAARFKYAEREDWTLGHQHNAALRYVAKSILRDLWIVASEDLEELSQARTWKN